MRGRGPVVILGRVSEPKGTMGETGAYQIIKQLRIRVELVHEASKTHGAIPSQDGKRVILRLKGALQEDHARVRDWDTWQCCQHHPAFV